MMSYSSHNSRVGRPGWTLSLAIGLLPCLALPAPAAPQETKRPAVHSEFVFDSFPYSPEAAALFSSGDARLLVAAFDQGWSVDKVLGEAETAQVDVLTILDELEQANLVRGSSDFDLRPGLLLIREAEAAGLESHLDASAAEFAAIIGEHWDEVERFAGSLEAGQDMPPGQIVYSALVGGVLMGGMIDALFEDKTLIPGPPERGRRGEGYYAWMLEGLDRPASVHRQSARVGRYTVFSVGTGVEEDLRVQIDELRSEGPVYEAEDAERWRLFASLFSRDYLFPHFKSMRGDLLDLHLGLRSARYTAFAEFAAWYYHDMTTRVVEALATGGRIAAPASSYKYAIRTGR